MTTKTEETLTLYDLTRYRIAAALGQQQAGAPYPQTYEVQPGVMVTLAGDHITVSSPDAEDLTIPAHLRDGRCWMGTRSGEDHLRDRLQAIENQRDAAGSALTPAADDALFLTARAVADNALRRYLNSADAAKAWGVTPGRVRQLCQTGRVTGAQKMGRDWLIPADASIPPGRRGPKGVTFMWTISNTVSGADLGTYPGRTAAEALDALAQDAGYADYAALEAEIPATPGEVVVERAD